METENIEIIESETVETVEIIEVIDYTPYLDDIYYMLSGRIDFIVILLFALVLFRIIKLGD